jgi:hypothetical protein
MSVDGYDGADHRSIASSKAARFLLDVLGVQRMGTGGRNYALTANSLFGVDRETWSNPVHRS